MCLSTQSFFPYSPLEWEKGVWIHFKEQSFHLCSPITVCFPATFFCILIFFPPAPSNRLKSFVGGERRKEGRTPSHQFPLKFFHLLFSSIFKWLFFLNVSIYAFPINTPCTEAWLLPRPSILLLTEVAMDFGLPNSASPPVLDRCPVYMVSHLLSKLLLCLISCDFPSPQPFFFFF